MIMEQNNNFYLLYIYMYIICNLHQITIFVSKKLIKIHLAKKQ